MAVNKVNLQLRQGLRYALIGPNGAGKSTLFNLITGQLRCDEGSEVLFKTQPIQHLTPNRICKLGIARTFQISSVFPRLSVLKNVEVALAIHQSKGASLIHKIYPHLRERAIDLLRDVGLDNQDSRIVGTLSYGDRKLLELALTLAIEPVVLLLDEPVAGVAARERWKMVEMINGLCREKKLTLMFCEHDMAVVAELSDWVAVLHRGSVLAEGTVDEIKQEKEVRRVYLGE